MSTTTAQTLRTILSGINEHRARSGEKAISHAQIGKATGLAKSTVSAILIGTYHSTTCDAHARRIHEHLRSICNAAGLGALIYAPRQSTRSTPSTKSTPSTPRPRKLHTVYCCPEGYIIHNDRTYYAGPEFAGLRITVAPIRGRDHAVRVTSRLATREIRPVDASTNQLGYAPGEAA